MGRISVGMPHARNGQIYLAGEEDDDNQADGEENRIKNIISFQKVILYANLFQEVKDFLKYNRRFS